MNKQEAIQQLGEGVDLKFFGILPIEGVIPHAMLLLWTYNPNGGHPQHEEMVRTLQLFDSGGVYLRKEVRAGKASTKDGGFHITGDSFMFEREKPTPEEFDMLTSGNIEIVQYKYDEHRHLIRV